MYMYSFRLYVCKYTYTVHVYMNLNIELTYISLSKAMDWTVFPSPISSARIQFCLVYQLKRSQLTPSSWYGRSLFPSPYSLHSFSGLNRAGGGRGLNWSSSSGGII